MPDKDVNINVRAKDVEATKRKLDGVAASTENVGKKTEQAGRKSQTGGKQIGGMGDKAGAAEKKTGAFAKTLAGVMAGVSGIIALSAGLFKFFKEWLGWLKQIGTATRELADSTKDLDHAAKALASQANIMGTEAGIETSRQQILQIAKAGNVTIPQAEGIAVATHSAFGTSGQELTPGQMGIAGAVAGFTQRKDLSGTEAGQLLKLLSAMGVGNVEEAKQRIQQLSTVQQASQEQTFGGFIGGATKAMVPRLADKASVEAALSSYASALDIHGGDQAAEKMKQMGDILQKPKILQAMGKQYSMSEMDIRNMPSDARMDLFAGWVSEHSATGTGQQYLLKSGMDAGQLGVAKAMYTKERLERRAMFGGLAEGATADQFTAEAKGYAATTQGRIEALGSAEERMAASATADQRYGDAVLDLAEQEFETLKAHGKLSWAPGKRDNQLPRFLRRRYFKRMNALPEGPKKEAIREYFKTPGRSFDPFPVEDIGRIGLMLLDAEQQGDMDSVVGPPAPAGYDWESAPPPVPAADLSGGQSRVMIFNEYHDYSIHLNPVAGNREDRLIGPPVDPYA